MRKKRYSFPNRLLVISWLALLLLPSAGVCQDETSVEPHVAEGYRGLDLIKEENYLAALSAFKKSYELKRTAFALFNIGMCYKALFRYVESIDALTQYVFHEKADPIVIIDAKRAIKEANALIGRVSIQGLPDEAVVRLNGTTIALTDEPVRLNPDELHVFRITKPGYEPFTQEVKLTPGGSITLSVKMIPKKVPLNIQCGGQGLVNIDEQDPVPCPYSGMIAPGHHTVRAKRGWKRGVQSFQISPGKGVTLVMDMQLEPTARKRLKVATGLLSSGLAVGVIGLAGVGVGTMYAVKRQQALHKGEDAADSIKSNGDNIDDWEIYNQADRDMKYYKSRYTKWFAISGPIVAVGAVLSAWGGVWKRKYEDITVAWSPTGLYGRF